MHSFSDFKKTKTKTKKQWNQVSHIRAERDVMAEAAGSNEWVTNLFYAFQDLEHLFIIMEYVPGGDLMTKLVSYDTFSLETTRFYIAEILLAVASVHDMNYIHRYAIIAPPLLVFNGKTTNSDIKPDNILIDREGHIKLTDFGLCTGFHIDKKLETVKQNIQNNRDVATADDLSKDAAMQPLSR